VTEKDILNPHDRVLILAPHPDDEVLANAGVIQKAVRMKLPLRIVFLTYGDNNEWSFLVYRKHPVILPRAVRGMGLVRHDEALGAAKTLDVPPESLTFLGYPDFRTLEIWCSHWRDRPPAESMLTRVTSVPYSNAFRRGAPYKGEEIVNDLKTLVREFRPTKIFVSHPADHNPDHKSLYLFLRVVLWDIENEINPEILPYLVHYRHWPAPRGYHPERRLTLPLSLEQRIEWQSSDLESEQIASKLMAVENHRSQYKTNKKYLLSFVSPNEIFGDFPEVALLPAGPVVELSRSVGRTEARPPEQLLDEERGAFIRVQEGHVHLEEDRLSLSINLSGPLGREVGASVYVFGYSKDRSFSQMPKLHVKFGEREHKIYDQDRVLPMETVRVERAPRQMTLEVSLESIGSPERVLTGTHTYLLGVIPLDWVAWRILSVQA